MKKLFITAVVSDKYLPIIRFDLNQRQAALEIFDSLVLHNLSQNLVFEEVSWKKSTGELINKTLIKEGFAKPAEGEFMVVMSSEQEFILAEGSLSEMRAVLYAIEDAQDMTDDGSPYELVDKAKRIRMDVKLLDFEKEQPYGGVNYLGESEWSNKYFDNN